MNPQLLTFVLLSLLSSTIFAQGCIQEGEKVILTGVINKEVFPGPPNYESVELGDTPEAVWVINLEQDKCVAGTYPDSTEEYASGSTSKVQLILKENGTNLASMLNSQAQVGGKIYPAQTGHHHTPVVLEVSEINTPPSMSETEQLSRAKEQVANAMKDPRKMRLLECIGVEVWQVKPKSWLPPSKDECNALNAELAAEADARENQ